jgi:hypothetical protein
MLHITASYRHGRTRRGPKSGRRAAGDPLTGCSSESKKVGNNRGLAAEPALVPHVGTVPASWTGREL